MAPPQTKTPSSTVPKQTAPRGLPQAVQAAGLRQGIAHVPLLSPTLPDAQQKPLEQLPLQHSPLLPQESPFGRHPRPPPTQVPPLEQLPLQHWLSLLQCLPWRLQPGGSAAAIPPMPTDASVPPTRAAPINLSALPREMLPLASPLASSSKVRLEVSWLTCAPSTRRAGH
jgi:hypothetical protein